MTAAVGHHGGMEQDEENASPKALPSPWTDLHNRPTPYDDFAVSQQAGTFVRGTLRRYPRAGWLLLALCPLLFLAPVAAAMLLL